MNRNDPLEILNWPSSMSDLFGLGKLFFSICFQNNWVSPIKSKEITTFKNSHQSKYQKFPNKIDDFEWISLKVFRHILSFYIFDYFFFLFVFSGTSGADNAKSANFFDDHNICKNSKQRWYVTCSSHVFTNPESTKIFHKSGSFYSFIM